MSQERISLSSVTVFLVGDSTLAPFDETLYFPRQGYGTRVSAYFKDSVRVLNLALSGRSSKSFVTEENYQKLWSMIRPGDFVVVAFGHNDEKPDPARYTNPTLGEDDPASFAYSLWTHYVQKAQTRGAHPILCTPIVRRSPSGDFEGICGHRMPDASPYAGGDYPRVIRELADRHHLPLVDMTRATQTLYRDLGPEKTRFLHAWTTSNPDSVDNSHLNPYGADCVASRFAAELWMTGCPLKDHLKQPSPLPDESLLVPHSDVTTGITP